MHIFHDKTGRVWSLELTIGAAKRVFGQCGIDLVRAIPDDDTERRTQGRARDKAQNRARGACPLRLLADDPYLLADVIGCLCGAQAKERGISADEFALLLDADTLDAAQNALIDEVILFFRPAKRVLLSALFRNATRFAGELEHEVAGTLKTPRIRRKIRSIFTDSLCNTPQSPASIRTISRSATSKPCIARKEASSGT